jgi:hypothetical protein
MAFSATTMEISQRTTDSAVTVDNRATFLRKILSSVVWFRFIHSVSLQQPADHGWAVSSSSQSYNLQEIIAGAQADYSLVHLRQSVSSAIYQSFVIALVFTSLNYGNAAQSGLPSYLHRRLQSVLNAAAWALHGLSLA